MNHENDQKNQDNMRIPDQPSCQYDLLDDPSERSVRYYIPGIGMVHMHYAGNYTRDFKDGTLDPLKFQPLVVMSAGLSYVDIAFDGFEPAILPNPDGLRFDAPGAQPLDGLQSQLAAVHGSMPWLRGIVADHFPEERRKTQEES